MIDFRKSKFTFLGLTFSGSNALAFGSHGIIFRPYRMNGKYVGIPTVTDIKKRFTLYPNPSTGQVKLAGFSCSKGCILQVYDASGKIVFESAVETSGEFDLDLSTLPNGIYSIRAGQHYSRFVKQQ